VRDPDKVDAASSRVCFLDKAAGSRFYFQFVIVTGVPAETDLKKFSAMN
jgi:hypothetical protein